MKNIKRIFLLLALAFIASKVLFSDINITQENNSIVIAGITSK